ACLLFFCLRGSRGIELLLAAFCARFLHDIVFSKLLIVGFAFAVEGVAGRKQRYSSDKRADAYDQGQHQPAPFCSFVLLYLLPDRINIALGVAYSPLIAGRSVSCFYHKPSLEG